MPFSLLDELARSIVLGVGAIWAFHLYRNKRAGRIPLFMAIYLAFPTAALLCDVLEWQDVNTRVNWLTAIIHGALDCIFIAMTRKETGETVRGMIRIEREMLAREAKVRAETLARIVLRELEDEPSSSRPKGLLEAAHAENQ